MTNTPRVAASGRKSLTRQLRRQIVPILFGTLCLLAVVATQIKEPHAISLPFLVNETTTRLARNLFLVLSLIIPVVAGMGLNFGIVVGAMCGQVGLIVVENAIGPGAPGSVGSAGVGGLIAAGLVSLPLSLLFGWLTGLLLNRARGREMITGMILGFFANGIYQLVFLLMTGPIIPLHNERLLLPSGVGLRNTIDLVGTRETLDRLVRPIFTISPSFRLPVPIATFAFIVLGCLAIRFFLRTKIGQDLRATGQDLHVAEIAGIPVLRVRLLAIVLSTALGAIGHILWLSNVGTMNTYQSHEQVGPYAIAALLVGGATVERATIWHAILGTLLFHTLFVISPIAGQTLLGSPQIGEYFREFIAYAVIGVTLALHAWNTRARE